MIIYSLAQIPAPCDWSTLKMPVPVFRIRITFKRIRIRMWILLVTVMRIRILTFTLMLMRIRILAYKERLKTSKKCSNRLIFHTGTSLARHLQIDADPDPNLAYPFDADANPDPDPTFQFDADPCGSGSTTLASGPLPSLDRVPVRKYGI
jgi:hypothetical protein